MAEFSVFTRQVTFLALCSFKYVVARVGSVSVWFRPSKGRPRNGIFGLDRAKNGARAQKWKRGEGKKENRRQTPSPLFYSPHFFARSLTLLPRSLLRNCTETLATQAYYAGKPVTNGLEPDKNGRTLFLLGHMIKAAICCVESQLK